MKIVVIGKRNHLNWDFHVKNAFLSLECEVLHLQINNRPWIIQLIRGILKVFLGKKIGNRLSNKLFIYYFNQKVKSFSPHLVFFTSASFIPIEFYKAMKLINPNLKVFAWEGDGGTSNIENIKIRNYIDVFFDSQREYVKRNIYNFSKIVHLPFAVDPSIYKNNFIERDKKIYFCGALTEDRNTLFSSLIDYNFVLKGWNWNKLLKKSKKFEIEEKTVNMNELVGDYNKYIAVLNIHQTENAHFNSDLNMRAFEVPSCGALLINDYREGIEEYFEPNKEICVYKNIDELKEILNELEKYPSNFDLIRENGYKRILAEHTYLHRMKKVLNIYWEINEKKK